MLYIKLRRGPMPLWFLGILLLTAPLGWIVARYFSEPMNRRLRGAKVFTKDELEKIHA
jgi:peptidoglycan/LPS O-acetylase OafA/YrhL